MQTLFRQVASPSKCGYLPDQMWSLEHEYATELSPEEYLQRMVEGWRRFGHIMFRPVCRSCTACQAIRVRVGDFRPDRSQRRNRKANEEAVTLKIGVPHLTYEKLALYDRYHAYQSSSKGWPEHGPKDPSSYADSFVVQPFDVEEWCYYIEERLVGVGYVDYLPVAPPGFAGSEGLSAIYFFYEPGERERGLGTWNVLCQIAEAVRRRLPYVYLGYYVPGSRSMEYKPRFVPNELRGNDGQWRPFRE